MVFENENMEMLFLDFDERIEKCFQALKNEYLMIRAGRANQHVLDKVVVEYYGSPTPLNQMANISVSDARCLTISVWDANALNLVEKAILAANIGLTPNNDGKVIRLIFPEVTEERRRELAKEVKRLGENSKVSVRNDRRKILEDLKKAEKNKEISEDNLSVFEKEVEKRVNEAIENIDEMIKAKEKEVMSV